MSPDHPMPDELELFLTGEAPPLLLSRIVRHLMRGCSTCMAVMAPSAEKLFAPPPVTADRYDFVIARALRTAASTAALTESVEVARAEVASTLEAIFADQRPPALPKTPAHDWAACELLLEEVARRRGIDIGGSIQLAELAVHSAQRLSAPWPEAQCADLRARAWAELGNAYRIADDLARADDAFAAAKEALAGGSGDQLLFARVCDLLGSLRRDQHLFADAHTLIDLAVARYLRHGESHLAGRSLLLKGQTCLDAGEPEAALEHFGSALPLLEFSREPRLIVVHLYNWIFALLAAGRIDEAAQYVWIARPLNDAVAAPLDKVRLCGLDARIALATGQPVRAESLFREVIAGFTSAGLVYDAAMVCLELAELLVDQQRPADVVELLDGSLPAFQEGGFTREALASLLVLRRSFIRGEATVAAVRETAERLRALGPPPRRR